MSATVSSAAFMLVTGGRGEFKLVIERWGLAQGYFTKHRILKQQYLHLHRVYYELHDGENKLNVQYQVKYRLFTR